MSDLEEEVWLSTTRSIKACDVFTDLSARLRRMAREWPVLALLAAYFEAAPFWTRAYPTWDIVNPFLHTFVFALGISWFFQRGFEPQSWIHRMNLVPLAAGGFDLVENLSIATLLPICPAQPEGMAWVATV